MDHEFKRVQVLWKINAAPPSSFGAHVGEEDKAPVLETFRKLFEARFIFDVRLLESHYMNGVTVQKTAYVDMSVFEKLSLAGTVVVSPLALNVAILVCAAA